MKISINYIGVALITHNTHARRENICNRYLNIFSSIIIGVTLFCPKRVVPIVFIRMNSICVDDRCVNFGESFIN